MLRLYMKRSNCYSNYEFHVSALPQYLQYRLQEYLQANRILFQNQNICSLGPVHKADNSGSREPVLFFGFSNLSVLCFRPLMIDEWISFYFYFENSNKKRSKAKGIKQKYSMPDKLSTKCNRDWLRIVIYG